MYKRIGGGMYNGRNSLGYDRSAEAAGFRMATKTNEWKHGWMRTIEATRGTERNALTETYTRPTGMGYLLTVFGKNKSVVH